MLNMWAIPADDLFSPNINILEKLEKMKIIETRMESMQKEIEQLRKENTGNVTLFTNGIIISAQAKELETLRGTTNDVKTKMDELIKQNEVLKMAFSVSLSSTTRPHSSLHTLIYKHIFLNTGDAYDANTGTVNHFTYCKWSIFRVFSKAYGSHSKGVSAGLFKNGQHEISAYAWQDSGFIGSSNGVSLLLEKGHESLS
uniref:C1q domain-containing protein n=1 Tax=Sinocyclocheilus rhinocerous TaxID=307959 RepID=A0A673J307_9TELE